MAYKTLILFALLPFLALGNGRKMQYQPDSDGYITCHNGHNLYTRALYGGHSLWRLETSDTPIFGAYHKTDNTAIYFTLLRKGITYRLDTIADCTAKYRGGERIYHLSDPEWGKGSITITAVALPDADGAIWRIEASNMPKGSTLTAYCTPTVDVKLSRNGDLGADPKNCFAPHPDKDPLSQCTVGVAGKEMVSYVKYADRKLSCADQLQLAAVYADAQHQRADIASRISINTPDSYINTLGPTISTAADAIFDGETYLHGAIGWRMPLCGWRGAYAGDFLGWHDRARSHFGAYAESQVTDVPPVYEHPNQDPGKNLARAEKRWGTQMYSDGYICRNPHRHDQMHHYDMNLCYIDALLWHLQWTGDTAFAREIWPVIARSLAWEKRNFDPDDDGLYDAYCCIWASDALFYSGGGVTHSSAYNYRANLLAAQIAQMIGEDPAQYSREAEKIRKAIDSELWMDDLGVWAEFRDNLGHKTLHDHPGLWTIYHAIDSSLGDEVQAFSAVEYIKNNLPQIQVTDDSGSVYGTVYSTTDWLPYAWSINNVAFAELYHTALAVWQARRTAMAYDILKGAVIDGMFMGDSPGNIGQVSHYDAARGECYRDFADPIGVLSRTLVQGLFGFSPDALNRSVSVTPGWPLAWKFASISHPDFDIDFNRTETADEYTLRLHGDMADTVVWTIPAYRDKVASVSLNGAPAQWSVDLSAVGHPYISITAPADGDCKLSIVWDGALVDGTRYAFRSDKPEVRQMHQGDMTWLAVAQTPGAMHSLPDHLGSIPDTDTKAVYQPVDLSAHFNSNIADIFRNEYLSPRSPYTTLQLPKQGIGEWCHPDDTAEIDDSALRGAGGTFCVGNIPFATAPVGNNVVYTSMYDRYPTSVTFPLSGSASGLNLLMAGSTNHMQCYADNAAIEVIYSDGSSELLRLIPPYNWCPIEQDYYINDTAFRVPTGPQLRVGLKDGVYGADLSVRIPADEVYGRRIPGGAATVVSLPLDPNKELKEMRLTAIAPDIVCGLIAATYIRENK